MKKLAVIIAVALLMTLVVGGNFWLKIRAERAQAVQLQARVVELEAAPRPSAAAPAPVPPPASIPAAQPAAAAPPATAPTRQQPAATPTDNTVAARTKELLASPAGNDMVRAFLLQQYPDLARELGLSAAETNQLLDVLARQQMDFAEDSMGLLGGGSADPNAMQNMQRNIEEKTRAHETELVALLGSKYAGWQQYQATAAARQQITRMQTAFGSANALTESQSKALLVSLAAAQSQLLAEQRNEPATKGNNPKEILENQIKVAEETTQRMLRAASPHLTIPQVNAYRSALEQDISMLKTIMGSMGNAP